MFEVRGQPQFRLVEQIGEGAMGEVLLVEHLGRQECVALKLLRPGLKDTSSIASRFRREAKALALLHHPNIVEVVDYGEFDDGRLFIAMEYVPGMGLDRWIDRRRSVAVSDVVSILVQLAGAITHAHSKGVMHRDLKPENLIIRPSPAATNFLKVLDFGIAKIFAPGHVDSVNLSAEDRVCGTLHYMAPERLENPTLVDPRTDIYAMGCIAFEMVAGAPPFSGTPMAVLHAHLTRLPPSLSSRCGAGEIPPELDEFVGRCLEKIPANRYSSGSEVISALRRIPHEKSPGVASGRRREF